MGSSTRSGTIKDVSFFIYISKLKNKKLKKRDGREGVIDPPFAILVIHYVV